MYNVLLVDDERIILEGIASVVEWERHGTSLVGKAVNGKQALEMIETLRPHIVITDIRMPEMGGIELIRLAKERDPGLLFIILSGHEEFSSAQAAMQYGVRHYLLKPCNENKIMQVLDEAVQELEERERRESFILNTRESMAKVLPQIKEQFLKEALVNKTYGKKEWDYYGELLDLRLEGRSLRLLQFQLEGEYEFEHLFALSNIATELVERAGKKVFLNTTLSERLVLLVEDLPLDQWVDLLKSIKDVYANYYKLTMTIAVSGSGCIQEIRKLYNETLECLSHRFYMGEGSVITLQDIRREVPVDDIQLEPDELSMAIRSGNTDKVERIAGELFSRLRQSKLDIGIVKSYVLELYLIIVRQSGAKHADEYMRKLVWMDSMETLDQAEEYVMRTAAEVTKQYFETNMQTQSMVIQQVIQYIQEHMHDESLSLTKLAKEIFYLNVDYLGKLFRKETGEKFSNYLMQIRMEEAKRLIRQSDHVKILDIAAQVGFGSNPQYFSQVFKRYTGSTPSEYKRLS